MFIFGVVGFLCKYHDHVMARKIHPCYDLLCMSGSFFFFFFLAYAATVQPRGSIVIARRSTRLGNPMIDAVVRLTWSMDSINYRVCPSDMYSRCRAACTGSIRLLCICRHYNTTLLMLVCLLLPPTLSVGVFFVRSIIQKQMIPKCSDLVYAYRE